MLTKRWLVEDMVVEAPASLSETWDDEKIPRLGASTAIGACIISWLTTGLLILN